MCSHVIARYIALQERCIEAIPALGMSDRQSFIYILTNSVNTVFYTGVTSDLKKRIWQHKEKQADGFTKRCNLTKLVYYEVIDDVVTAIEREKQITGGSRQKKIDLVNSLNPDWHDLSDDL